MIAVSTPYINADYYDNRLSSSNAYYSVYVNRASDDDASKTADLSELWNDEALMLSVKQYTIQIERDAVRKRINQLFSSFISNGGETLGAVANRVFVEIAAEIVLLPFNDVLAQFSPTNNEILIDLSFNKGIEVSIGKYLEMSGDDNVMFSLSIDDEPYAINMKNIHDLKNVLLETLSC